MRCHLDQPGFVTLVIEDEHGVRVRNLISETYFPAGDNVAWWDGLDDLGRDKSSEDHGIYNVSGKLVAPGSYTVRGLTILREFWRKELECHFAAQLGIFAAVNHTHTAATQLLHNANAELLCQSHLCYSLGRP